MDWKSSGGMVRSSKKGDATTVTITRPHADPNLAQYSVVSARKLISQSYPRELLQELEDYAGSKGSLLILKLREAPVPKSIEDVRPPNFLKISVEDGETRPKNQQDEWKRGFRRML